MSTDRRRPSHVAVVRDLCPPRGQGTILTQSTWTRRAAPAETDPAPPGLARWRWPRRTTRGLAVLEGGLLDRTSGDAVDYQGLTLSECY